MLGESPMLTFEEGNKLLISASNSTSKERTTTEIVDLYLTNVDSTKMILLCFTLALCNAGDAVEILCAGFLLSEMGDKITTQEKEFLSSSVFMGMLVGGVFAGTDRSVRSEALTIKESNLSTSFPST
jgi:hypothetical protein